jgi:hypothetical protein
MFDERGDLVMLEEDSIEENNFFQVLAQFRTSLTYTENPLVFG